MPVAANCSSTISAACRPIPYEPEAWMTPVTSTVTEGKDGSELHCLFTTSTYVKYQMVENTRR